MRYFMIKDAHVKNVKFIIINNISLILAHFGRERKEYKIIKYYTGDK